MCFHAAHCFPSCCMLDTQITTDDPRWIGAWWLGFLILGVASIAAGIPVCFIPRTTKPVPVNEEKMTSDGTVELLKGEFDSLCTTGEPRLSLWIFGLDLVYRRWIQRYKLKYKKPPNSPSYRLQSTSCRASFLSSPQIYLAHCGDSPKTAWWCWRPWLSPLPPRPASGIWPLPLNTW